MKHIRRMMALLMCLFLLPVTAWSESQRLPLQDTHKVSYKQRSEQLSMGAKLTRWEITTAHADVTRALNALAKGYVDEIVPGLEKLKYKETARLDVYILNSRTGLTWMSFMVQSRYVRSDTTRDVRFTTRTYDMASGQWLTLGDLFPADSEAWSIMAAAVRERINTYYPDVPADATAVDTACTLEAIEKMDFTLHGMSLVLHLHAADFYPGKEQLIEVPLYYPDIRPFMTEKAQAETDNLTYYDTVALTYDDGPTGWVTRDMLDLLMKTGTRATFFLLGANIGRYTQYVQREHDAGHAIATHFFQHLYADRTAASVFQQMPPKVNKAHINAIGLAPTYARAPGGLWKPMARAKAGWPLIQWTAEARDWEDDQGRNPYLVKSQILGMTEDGGVILMHDVKKNCILSSEMFIPALQERGFLFLTVDELFAKDGVALQPDTPYWRCVGGDTSEP